MHNKVHPIVNYAHYFHKMGGRNHPQIVGLCMIGIYIQNYMYKI
jgi:hypothetical protein